MTVKECYEAMGGDYEDVKGRLLTDARVEKYLIKFKDANDIQKVVDSLEEQDYESAFRHVHNIKGLSLNLGLSKLRNSSDVLCEELRGGKPEGDISSLLDDMKKDFDATIAAINQLG
ncbi:MAG: Hpt domain-containing protein [Lachnospiraceae bacterium]|nr:Hpt domain-containing protein [Lachnospiraceae bacterium]